MTPRAIDLHTHTTCSDGTDTPTALITKAADAGLIALALTDHDTTAGWDEAAQAVGALDVDFTLVVGTEFSCVYVDPDGRRTGLHLLGYLFDREHVVLRAERARLRESRTGRAREMVDKLSAAGHGVDWERVSELAGGGSIGRPHIAHALVESGSAASFEEAFHGLIAKGSPFHVPKQDLEVLQALDLIRAAGGVPVIAHVLARTRGPVLSLEQIEHLIAAGLAGIEVDHPNHAPDDRALLRDLVDRHDLIATGSSDYHGDRKTTSLGCESTPPEMFGRLIESASGGEPIRSPGR